ncbi:hypothetical protein HGRIS_008684 [Hohenbuehelia grisea]|uniref:S-adenosyl-L-methionine-dependent methyltransferase n=1 Tax=Hohenbuehelia grisea TaxID=104357 RepID=A0ABR3J8X4_9AGAR
MATAFAREPSGFLPHLIRLNNLDAFSIARALQSLQDLYWPSSPSMIPFPLPALRTQKPHFLRRITDDPTPDSGYASADEGEDELCEPGDEGDLSDNEALRADSFERAYAVRWVTGFLSRSDVWLCQVTSEIEDDARAQLVEAASRILSAFSGVDEQEEAELTRTFSFPLLEGSATVEVELNDAPLLSQDHTSVGLQSWASSILLAEKLCLTPDHFGLQATNDLRILELGAGTGLLSIVAAKLLNTQSTVVATDYHPDVLANLRANVRTNFPDNSPSIGVHTLDWESPQYGSEYLDRSFDVILAADVIYHPDHARWIHDCVARLLAKPECGSGLAGGVFWLVIPVRLTGRHEGLDDTVDAVFPDVSTLQPAAGTPRLVILEKQRLERQSGGVGRADEAAYRLFKIGWV